jgi:hypothetical protein
MAEKRFSIDDAWLTGSTKMLDCHAGPLRGGEAWNDLGETPARRRASLIAWAGNAMVRRFHDTEARGKS